MVMAGRPGVKTASLPATAIGMAEFAGRMATALALVPLKRPFDGPEDPLENLGQNVTREVMKAFFGYATSLDTPSLRSFERVIDDLARAVLPPFVHRMKVAMGTDSIGGVPGMWYRPSDREPIGVIIYLHGGGYIATSPGMYAAFTGYLSHITGCRLFVADYRLAPEFPFPAGLEDAIAVYEAVLDTGVPPERVLFAGDSGGGGLVDSLLLTDKAKHLPRPGGVLLFSPEVELVLDEPSVTENADKDILPAQIPTEPYLHGLDAHNPFISPVARDLAGYPPTLVAFGDEEMFRDAIRRFCADLRRDGVDVVELEEPDMFHVYPILMPWSSASHRLYDEIRAFTADLLAPPGRDQGAGPTPMARAEADDHEESDDAESDDASPTDDAAGGDETGGVVGEG